MRLTGRRISVCKHCVYVMSGCFPVYGAEDNGRWSLV